MRGKLFVKISQLIVAFFVGYVVVAIMIDIVTLI